MHPGSKPRLHVFLEPQRSGTENMRRDAALLAAAADDAVVLRLNTWSPPAVSIGTMQHAAALLDLAACRAAGVDVVQRPTGGRAVLHWEEITYALVASVRGAWEESQRAMAPSSSGGVNLASGPASAGMVPGM